MNRANFLLMFFCSLKTMKIIKITLQLIAILCLTNILVALYKINFPWKNTTLLLNTDLWLQRVWRFSNGPCVMKGCSTLLYMSGNMTPLLHVFTALHRGYYTFMSWSLYSERRETIVSEVNNKQKFPEFLLLILSRTSVLFFVFVPRSLCCLLDIVIL